MTRIDQWAGREHTTNIRLRSPPSSLSIGAALVAAVALSGAALALFMAEPQPVSVLKSDVLSCRDVAAWNDMFAQGAETAAVLPVLQSIVGGACAVWPAGVRGQVENNHSVRTPGGATIGLACMSRLDADSKCRWVPLSAVRTATPPQ